MAHVDYIQCDGPGCEWKATGATTSRLPDGWLRLDRHPGSYFPPQEQVFCSPKCLLAALQQPEKPILYDPKDTSEYRSLPWWRKVLFW